jgi:hypothetical protein
MIEQSGFEIAFTHGDYPTLTKESSFYLYRHCTTGAVAKVGLRVLLCWPAQRFA